MLRYFFATFCISFVAGLSVLEEDFLLLESRSDFLEWPEIYTLKATKLSLTSNLVLEHQVWSSNTSFRIDYNGGAVKTIINTYEVDGDTESDSYEIIPETTDGITAKVVCNKAVFGPLGGQIGENSVLPSYTEDFEIVGNETIKDIDTVKFEYTEKDREEDKRMTIWAYYDDIYEAWVPVRYEEVEYNAKLGKLVTHDIWDYSDFCIEVDNEVFNVNEYCDTDNTVLHTEDSEKVTKELMFINPHNKNHVDHVFRSFIKKFQREYAHETEHALRKAIFHKNMRMVSTVNKKKLGYTLGINHFSDRTPEELERSRGLKRRAPGKVGNIPFPYNESTLNSMAAKLPSQYDARLYGLVNPVKDQGDCRSCWSYGTTSAAEGALARTNGGRLLTLANQALVDCVWSYYGAEGCNGGTDNAAFEWMMDFGLPTEEEYGSYKDKEDFCHIDLYNMTLYQIRGFTDVTPFNNDATKVALLHHGPISTSVHATTQFHQYSYGIFYQYDCDPTVLNHEVTLVGYGERNGEVFWIIKNSWGNTWGMDGYMLISAKNNTCGITTEPTYVVI